VACKVAIVIASRPPWLLDRGRWHSQISWLGAGDRARSGGPFDPDAREGADIDPMMAIVGPEI
jgi:hypothetical protein